MRVETVNRRHYRLADDDGSGAGSLVYKDAGLREAKITCSQGLVYSLKQVATGVWAVALEDEAPAGKLLNSIKVEPGGVMSIRKFYKRKKYTFRKSANWKLRFALVNTDYDELLGLIPLVNWEKGAHDYGLQLNDEFENECDSFLILQAIHCANCSLSMMTGGEVPALVSI